MGLSRAAIRAVLSALAAALLLTCAVAAPARAQSTAWEQPTGGDSAADPADGWTSDEEESWAQSGGAWEDPDSERWPVDSDLESGGVDPNATAAPAPAPKKTSTTRVSGTIRAANVPYGKLIAVTARRYGVSVSLFTALVWQESGFNAKARSRSGARGLTQLMPATARGLGVRRIYDPAQNLAGGAGYLRAQLLRFRSARLALAAYNAGPGAVTRFNGVPPYAETRGYVTRILAIEQRLRRAGVR